MAFKSTFSRFPFLLLLLLCFLQLPHNIASDFKYGGLSNKQAIFQKFQSRKVFRAMKEEVHWDELRKVPSGPDPLHHNGGSPKKPRTP